MNTTEPFALSDFVSCDETRPALCKPWKHGDHVYATDGRIMVRVNADLFPDIQPEPSAPRAGVDKYFAEPLPDTHWQPPTADMKAVEQIKCDQCVDGEDTCPHCERTGKCENCDGSGFYMPHFGIDVGKTRLNMFYVEKINRLPGAMLYMPPDRDAEKPVHFRFDHGIGVLMPMRVS